MKDKIFIDLRRDVEATKVRDITDDIKAYKKYYENFGSNKEEIK